MKIALLIVGLAAAGGGFFGWQQHQELRRIKADLATTQASLDLASAEARKATTEASAAKKELEDQKAALQQARIDADAAKGFLEMEKSHSARLQQELALTREQIAYMRTRSSGPGRYPERMVPTPGQPKIKAILIAPNYGLRHAYG